MNPLVVAAFGKDGATREKFSVCQTQEAYRLRWQIELLFKERKFHISRMPSVPTIPGLRKG